MLKIETRPTSTKSATAATAATAATTRVYLKEGPPGIYTVTDASGKVLIEQSRHPEFEAAQHLARQGVTGILETWRVGGTFPCMRVDIARAAAHLTAQQNALNKQTSSKASHP